MLSKLENLNKTNFSHEILIPARCAYYQYMARDCKMVNFMNRDKILQLNCNKSKYSLYKLCIARALLSLITKAGEGKVMKQSE